MSQPTSTLNATGFLRSTSEGKLEISIQGNGISGHVEVLRSEAERAGLACQLLAGREVDVSFLCFNK